MDMSKSSLRKGIDVDVFAGDVAEQWLLSKSYVGIRNADIEKIARDEFCLIGLDEDEDADFLWPRWLKAWQQVIGAAISHPFNVLGWIPSDKCYEFCFDYDKKDFFLMLQKEFKALGIETEVALQSSDDGLYVEPFYRFRVYCDFDNLSKSLREIERMQDVLVHRGWHPIHGCYIAAVDGKLCQRLLNIRGFSCFGSLSACLVEYHDSGFYLLDYLERLSG